MGRWSASHWKTAVFGWLAFVVAAIAIGNAVGTKNISMQDANVGQSRKADQILSKGFPQADPQTELVCSCRARRAPSTIPRSERRSTTSPPPSRETRRSRTSNRLDPKNRDQVSNNRRTVIVTWNMKGKADVAKKIDGVEASVAKVGDRHPGFNVGETGSVSSGKALDKMFADPAEAGRRALHPDHDRRAPARLRRARRRRRPAAAGALGCDRNDWRGPIPSPPPSGTPCTSWGRPFCSHCCA
jgi:hypothetical protein